MAFEKQNNSRAALLKQQRSLLISPSYVDKLLFLIKFVKEQPSILMTVTKLYISMN